jgi:hypothetical protein
MATGGRERGWHTALPTSSATGRSRLDWNSTTSAVIARGTNPLHLEAVTHAENVRRSLETRTHCKWGHPFDEANTYRLRTSRFCRACNRRRVSAYKARRAATQKEIAA